MNLLRKLFLFCFVLFLFACKEPVPRPVIRIIPLPAQCTDMEGVFAITNATKIGISNDNAQLRHIAEFLTSHMAKYFGVINSPITAYEFDAKESIFLKLNSGLNLGMEDYHLTVTPDGILIEAAALNGLFYGVQTLIQLMPPSPKQLTDIVLPADKKLISGFNKDYRPYG